MFLGHIMSKQKIFLETKSFFKILSFEQIFLTHLNFKISKPISCL